MKMRQQVAAMPLESAPFLFPMGIEPASVRSRSGIRGMISITLAAVPTFDSSTFAPNAFES